MNTYETETHEQMLDRLAREPGSITLNDDGQMFELQQDGSFVELVKNLNRGLTENGSHWHLALIQKAHPDNIIFNVGPDGTVKEYYSLANATKAVEALKQRARAIR